MTNSISEQLQNINMISILVRFILITICSGILGYDRERRNQAAGFRTHIIVGNASALVMMTNIYISQCVGYTDLVRMPAAVITGLGFLGAGAILVTKNHEVRGLTTAAGLWSVAIIGISIGAGFYEGGVICFVVIFFTMEVLRKADKFIGKTSKTVEVYCEADSCKAAGKLIRQIKIEGCSIGNFEMHSLPYHVEDSVALFFTLQVKDNSDSSSIINNIQKIDGILFAEMLSE